MTTHQAAHVAVLEALLSEFMRHDADETCPTIQALTAAIAAMKQQGVSLTFTDATIDKLQDVMAVHGFTVPVRVISDAFRTAIYAAAPTEASR